MTMTELTQQSGVYQTDLPARLDRLPWGRFHTLLVIALGITWLLDGLEVTLAGSVSGALKNSRCCSCPTVISVWRAALPGRGGARSAVLRLADRPFGAEKTIFHYVVHLR